MDRAIIVHENFQNALKDGIFPYSKSAIYKNYTSLKDEEIIEIFHSQIQSRNLDRISRKLQKEGEGFYTIGSSGHEGNAAIAKAFRYDDMAFLHYRDCAFQIQRSKLLKGQSPIWDILLSFAASSDDPISGGHHKVLGSKSLFIPPQTSTIASHLPKAVGAAYSIPLTKRIKTPFQNLKSDGVILCSFGDASFNHSTAQGAFNTASWIAYQNIPLPIIFICEDNNIGISTKTPTGWIENKLHNQNIIKYFKCNGLDILETYKVALKAENYVRKYKKPAFIHMECVRLHGHAGSDVELSYLKKADIEKTEANDPLLHSAKILLENNILNKDEILKLYNMSYNLIERQAKEVITKPKLETAKEVMQSIIPNSLEGEYKEIEKAEVININKLDILEKESAAIKVPQHMARLINWALVELMDKHTNIIMVGEDIGPKGGVYNVTNKIHDKFGSNRVINSLLDEQSILGLAIGLAHNGFLPIPEIQFLAYLHNAEDQLRGEAATLSFFSNSQYTNPMVIRIAGLGYQKGFGGHFHNDNAIAVLRDIPGVIIACPSNARDAFAMIREAHRLAHYEQRIVVFLEPIALYMTKDLHDTGDKLWSFKYQRAALKKKHEVNLGDINIHGKGKKLAIITYANGYYLSRKAEKQLRDNYNIDLRVIDIRWLAPLPEEQILKAINGIENILIVDECRRSGSVSEALASLIHENSSKKMNLKRLTAEDSFIPLGKAATLTLPSEAEIINAALNLLRIKK